MNLHSALTQIISETGSQQFFLSEDEQEIFEQVESKEPSLEKEEAKEYTPAQEYIDLFTELSTSEQNVLEFQKDSTAIYDESSSSENEADKGDSLSQESLILDPVEEEEILVEAYLPDIHSQVLFHDPYAHFLQTFGEGSRVFLSSMLQTERKSFKATIIEQKECEFPCLSSLLKELSKKDQSWDHLKDWLHWKTMFVSQTVNIPVRVGQVGKAQ